MKKRTFILSLSALMALGAVAAPLTPEQALQRARKNGPARVAARAQADMKPVYSAKTESGATAAYVFNNPGQGYMILSADDVAFPVLGYSDSGSIDPSNMSPELQWWLSEYGRQIDWALEHGAKTAPQGPRTVEGRTAIPALIKTKWNQDAPYNDKCPTPKNSTTRTYTGCVATSMAQVMNYHKYPLKGEGIVKYYCNTINKNLTMNFEREEFDWDNMLNVYESGQYTEEQGDAVALLMKACGYSVEMSYGTSSSGASGCNIAVALKKYFKYDESVEAYPRILFSGTEWDQMVYDNLKNYGPLVINGQSPLTGGHSFVCDGYDGNGYYHINWGWGGVSDGYYSLEALNPDAQGIGGATGGFNFHENAIFGVRPATEEPVENVMPERILQYGTSAATLSGKKLTFTAEDYLYTGWCNSNANDAIYYVGAIVEPVDGTSGETQTVQGLFGNSEQIGMRGFGAYFASGSSNDPNVTLPDLADGKYRVYLACKRSDTTDAEFEPVYVPWGMRNYVALEVKDGAYTVTKVPISTFEITNVETLSPVYAGKNITFKAHIANPSDIELCMGLAPQLIDANGKVAYTGESVLVTLAAGESMDYEWRTRFYNDKGAVANVKKDTEYTLKMYDPQTTLYFEGVEMPVTMKPNPGTATLLLSQIEFTGAERQPLTVLGREFPSVNIIKPGENVVFNLGFKVQRGYYDGTVSLNILQQDPANPATNVSVADDYWHQTPYLEAGDNVSYEIPITIDDMKDNTIYAAEINYTSSGTLMSFGTLYFMRGDVTGVEDIFSDNDGEVRYYNLQGMPVLNPMPGQVVIERKGGKTAKIVWK